MTDTHQEPTIRSPHTIPVSEELIWDSIRQKFDFSVPAICAGTVTFYGHKTPGCGMFLENGLSLTITKKGKLRVKGYPEHCKNRVHLYGEDV